MSPEETTSITPTDFLFAETVAPDPRQLVGKGMTKESTLAVLQQAEQILQTFEPFEPEPLEHTFRAAAEAAGIKTGTFFTPLRVAVTGKTVSPPLFASIAALGREKTIERLRNAQRLLAN